MDLWRNRVRNLLKGVLASTPRQPHSDETYALLSSDSDLERPSTPRPRRRNAIFRIIRSCFTLRRILILIVLIPVFIVILILWNGVPPSYADVRDYEKRLPQHNLSLSFPEGDTGMYLRFPGHLWGHGLNNILQETCVTLLSFVYGHH
jgi:hypothetical protein